MSRAAVLAHRGRTLARAGVNSLRAVPEVPNPPLVSVVTATYNWSSVLPYAIRAVRAQTYPSWEMIVVGDACTDDSDEVVRSFGDGRIRWHNRGENSGSQSLPNNDGVALARGEYVAYLGHDDLWAPDHLARLVATARREGSDVTFALCELIGPPATGLRQLSGATSPRGYAGGHLPPSAIMHRRTMPDDIGGGWRDYREIMDPPDIEFLERALAGGQTFACSWALTAFKFPSAQRRNSYVEKPSWEQARMMERMGSERAFRLRELARVTVARLRHSEAEFDRYLAVPVRGAEPGSAVKAMRRVRGLDP